MSREKQIEEMAEKLKSIFDNSTNRIYQGNNIHRFIDQTAREMLGDSNEEK